MTKQGLLCPKLTDFIFDADKPETRFAIEMGQPQDVKEGMAELNVPKNQSIALICPFVKE